MMRKKNFKAVLYVLLAFGLIVTTYMTASPVISRSVSAQSAVSDITFAVPTAVQKDQGNLMVWDCPGCPGG